jgi:hypothetical protein
MSFSDFSQDEIKWIEQSGAERMARVCVVYARALNRLNFEEMSDILSDEVTYTSQSVFDTLDGRKKVESYFRGKFQAIRQSGRKVLGELGFLQGTPCVLVYQAGSDIDTNWTQAPIAAMQLTVGNDGSITKFLMITVAPSPAEAERCRIFPGCDTEGQGICAQCKRR